jgi:hypothetical protein
MLLSVKKGKTVGKRVLLKCLVAQAVKDKSGNNGSIYMQQAGEAAQRSGCSFKKKCKLFARVVPLARMNMWSVSMQ